MDKRLLHLDTMNGTRSASTGTTGNLHRLRELAYSAFDTVDPDLKPMSQTEYTLGLEKKIFDNLSTSVRFVYKHLNRTIEDVGTITPEGELYYITNPGYGYTLPISQGGKFLDIYPTTPKAKRNYVGVTFALDKRFSDNWMAGFSSTWSQLTGTYSGLASSDEIDVNGDGASPQHGTLLRRLVLQLGPEHEQHRRKAWDRQAPLL